MPAILGPTRRQVNAKGLLREVHAAEEGALLYARHGQGAHIYCGLALFRQVRAGVPGGVRLYVNLLSQGRALRDSPATNKTR